MSSILAVHDAALARLREQDAMLARLREAEHISISRPQVSEMLGLNASARLLRDERRIAAFVEEANAVRRFVEDSRLLSERVEQMAQLPKALDVDALARGPAFPSLRAAEDALSWQSRQLAVLLEQNRRVIEATELPKALAEAALATERYANLTLGLEQSAAFSALGFEKALLDTSLFVTMAENFHRDHDLVARFISTAVPAHGDLSAAALAVQLSDTLSVQLGASLEVQGGDVGQALAVRTFVAWIQSMVAVLPPEARSAETLRWLIGIMLTLVLWAQTSHQARLSDEANTRHHAAETARLDSLLVEERRGNALEDSALVAQREANTTADSALAEQHRANALVDSTLAELRKTNALRAKRAQPPRLE